MSGLAAAGGRGEGVDGGASIIHQSSIIQQQQSLPFHLTFYSSPQEADREAQEDVQALQA